MPYHSQIWWGAIAILFRINQSSWAPGLDRSDSQLCLLQGLTLFCFFIIFSLWEGGDGKWFFHLQAAFQLKEKWRGQMLSFSLSVAITNMTLLLFFSSVHYFSRELFFFFFRMSDLAKLFCHWSKHICLYDIMNINFLRSCMLWQCVKVLFNKYRKKWSMQGLRWMRRKSVLFLIQGASELGL